jgi:hypothetical protein
VTGVGDGVGLGVFDGFGLSVGDGVGVGEGEGVGVGVYGEAAKSPSVSVWFAAKVCTGPDSQWPACSARLKILSSPVAGL